jgi:hypothetical protein
MRVKKNREGIATAVRRGLKPRTVVGLLPAQAERLARLLTKRRITLVGIVPNPATGWRHPGDAWLITAVPPRLNPADADATSTMSRTFDRCLTRAGFQAVNCTSDPLAAGDGIFYVCLAVLTS